MFLNLTSLDIWEFQSQVSRIAAKKSEICLQWERNENLDRKRRRTGKDADVETALKTWFTEGCSHDVPLSGPILEEKAKKLAETLNKPDFKLTNGWLCRWEERNCIVYKKAHGEKNDADLPAADNWMKEQLPKLPDDVYNADETGIYFRAIPDGTLIYKSEKLSGGKKQKERITALVACNMSGTDKRHLMVIGKSKNPRCFRGVTDIPVDYQNNANAWMAGVLFRQWCCDLDRDAKRKEKNCLVDNCSAHSADVDAKLKNLKLIFLPLNTTSCIQPCDQGIIHNLKYFYRQQIVNRIVTEIDSGQDIQANTGNEETTSSDITPPDGIDQSEFDTYVNIDYNLQCIGMRADEEICVDVLQAKPCELEVPEDSDDDDDDSDEPVLTASGVLMGVKALRRIFGVSWCAEL
ncbi:tigger transposable element-derived protein 6-like [Gigantopelta aegis]|uniref:tigger transposable element-derived protein 6-like n=1 Tax=Gigantopelta aegis TaxID=1735272 RepID=UPI001B88A917|nr:tigger transposable element-derived protein 6-like [Gigantopelta aegis]